FSFEVSNSFVISSASTVTEADIWSWAFPGSVMTNMDWAIGSAAFGTNFGSGNVATVDTPIGTNGFGYNIAMEKLALPSIVLGPGTYWLSLGGAANGAYTNDGNPIYWDQSDGPSVAFQNTRGALAGCDPHGAGTSCSESFQILGNQGSQVPEPAS